MQDPNHPGFVGKGERYDCEQCIGSHAKEFKFPTAGDENQQARWLYQVLQSQQRMVAGMSGAVSLGLEFTSFEPIFEMYRIPYASRRLLFEKILLLDSEARAYQDRQAETARRKAEADARMDAMR